MKNYNYLNIWITVEHSSAFARYHDTKNIIRYIDGLNDEFDISMAVTIIYYLVDDFIVTANTG